ncbi:ABC transporter permease [Sphaerisporangium corydalis]|uniref:ABC transporter permease n=1 Tax=Sphaerisporangium corydalis TaxID=1441875 RepID=A0ABV9EGQ8_9ACTN|nr:ABC transporter permease [Sphaerisporangium corydalis]
MADRWLTYAWLSYKGLYTWLNPWGYLSSRVVRPIAVCLLFLPLGGNDEAAMLRLLIGSTLLVMATDVVFGVALAVGNERSFGTLGTVIASPVGLPATLAARAFPHVVDSFLGSVTTAVIAAAVYDIPLTPGQIARGVLALVVVGVSSTGVGIAVSSVALRFRDVFLAPNIARVVLIALSGALVSAGDLPEWLGVVSGALPIHHAITYVLGVPDGRAFALVLELAVGAAWATAGYVLVGLMIRSGRRAATVDLT